MLASLLLAVALAAPPPPNIHVYSCQVISGTALTVNALPLSDEIVHHHLHVTLPDVLKSRLYVALDRSCSVARIRYADGTSWTNPIVAGPLPTTVAEEINLYRQPTPWRQRHGYPTPFPTLTPSPQPTSTGASHA